MSFALLLAKNVHLSIGEEFCAFPCQKICTSVFPLLNGAEFTLSVAKTLHFSKQFAFFALSRGVIDRRSKQQRKRSNFRLHRSSLSSKKSKKWIKLIPKTIGNRKKRLCVRLRLGNKHHLKKSADRKAQIRKAYVPLTELICAFRSADFLRWGFFPKRNLTHNLFFYFQ